ncbi:MAG: hypothetical protein A3G24_18185 [Betaproteobacteria bacterium RIFCSPLOWO2_12_FULL_62_13]|nr:MAG: hypothetical protein A3G24_18185 [Betaproteobacteria bacterium RIFCSPLOWO2_12_FULL_62_13]
MIQLRKRGPITAVICSDPFRTLGKTQARVLGLPDLPLVMIPHPLGGLSIEQVRGRALVAIPQVVELIKDQFK